jgi:hypothetical protein
MFWRTEEFFSWVRNTDRPNRRLLVVADSAVLAHHTLFISPFLSQNIFLNTLFYNVVIYYFPIKQETFLQNF